MKKIIGIICMLMLVNISTMVTGSVNNQENNIKTSENNDIDWWQTTRHDPEHTGYSLSPAPNTNNLYGSMTIGSGYSAAKLNSMAIASEPLVCDGKVYVTSLKEGVSRDLSYIHCLDVSTGQIVWSHEFEASWGTSIQGSPTIDGDNIYVSVFYMDYPSYYGMKLECRDKDTGDLLWANSYDYSIRTPIVDNGKIYVFGRCGNLGCLYCLDASNYGSELWSTEIPIQIGTTRFSDPTVSNVYDKVVISYDQDIICFDGSNGSIVWTYTITGNMDELLPVISNDGKVFVSTYLDCRLYCLDLIGNGDGTTDLLWSHDVGEWINFYPAVAYGRVYICSDYIYCFDANTGEEIWSYYVWFAKGSPTIADEKVFVSSYHHDEFYDQLLCLDAIGNGDGTTNLIWSYNIASWVACSVVIADSALYTLDWNCNISVFKDLLPNAPGAPIIDGPANGKAGVEYDYTFCSIDPDGEDVYYWVEWGDNTHDGWVGPYASGEIVTVSHTWSEKGDYTIQAKAKDTTGLESNWATLPVTMPLDLPGSQQSSPTPQTQPNTQPISKTTIQTTIGSTSLLGKTTK